MAFVELQDHECAAGAAPPIPLRTHSHSSGRIARRNLHAQFASLSFRPLYTFGTLFGYRTSAAIGGRLQPASPDYGPGPYMWCFSQRRVSEEMENYLDGLRTWLARSEPLSIPISIRGMRQGSWLSESSSRSTEELLRVASRWRLLRFATSAPSSLVQRLAGGRFDALEELVLRYLLLEDSSFDPTNILSFTRAPRLRKLTVDSACRIPMPWAQLTDVSLTNRASPEVFLDIISQCTNVVRASVVTTGSSVFVPARADVVVLDHLRILSITWSGEEVHHMLFLDCLSAPVLDELHLRYYRLDGDPGLVWSEMTFTAFQLRSPNISKLKMEGDGIAVQYNALIATLQHAPSLTDLSVIDCCTNRDALIYALHYTDGIEQPLVPCLHTLALADVNMTGLYGRWQDHLPRAFASRWWTDAELATRSQTPAVARWRQIRIRDDSTRAGFQCSPVFRRAMEDLRHAGLIVDLVEYGSWNAVW
ncbi:hypothetical protein MSAN_01385600 [Mycena sanguinolenta]|uniref:F-box domain protein n=1 Tax=Mycena sanguinolenta TaxID=230812 RepID=A0A8H7D0A4_9AGAR|nr:hypothetical protein MSAN_01385600 [Mycena sanguinolenta]